MAPSDRLDGDGDALADADAHGGKPELPAPLREAMSRCHRKPGTRHAQRMTKCNRTPMRIDLFGVIGKPELPQAC